MSIYFRDGRVGGNVVVDCVAALLILPVLYRRDDILGHTGRAGRGHGGIGRRRPGVQRRGCADPGRLRGVLGRTADDEVYPEAQNQQDQNGQKDARQVVFRRIGGAVILIEIVRLALRQRRVLLLCGLSAFPGAKNDVNGVVFLEERHGFVRIAGRFGFPYDFIKAFPEGFRHAGNRGKRCFILIAVGDAPGHILPDAHGRFAAHVVYRIHDAGSVLSDRAADEEPSAQNFAWRKMVFDQRRVFVAAAMRTCVLSVIWPHAEHAQL